MNDLKEAIAFARSIESKWAADMKMPDGQFVMTFDSGEKAPDNEIIGPVTPRGGHSGIVYRGGKVLAEWGDTTRADMTFSVAKSFLSLLAGLAVGDGLIKSLDDKVGFTEEHNRDITWRHLLTQTSEWSGTLFGKEDRIDHNRVVGLQVAEAPKGTRRQLKKPGTYYEYNDVRVNRLSLSLLELFKEPLPSVLKRRIMDPIGASSGWKWDGYRNSTVTIDGKPMVSVPGGTHWGGGVSIHAEDQARLGLLMLNRGAWDGRRVVSSGWIERATTPAAINPSYGYLWWLNTGRKRYPSASPQSLFASGAGGNCTWIDPQSGIVAVMRWMDPAAMNEFIGRVMAALTS